MRINAQRHHMCFIKRFWKWTSIFVISVFFETGIAVGFLPVELTNVGHSNNDINITYMDVYQNVRYNYIEK